jgi:hypothetical protein
LSLITRPLSIRCPRRTDKRNPALLPYAFSKTLQHQVVDLVGAVFDLVSERWMFLITVPRLSTVMTGGLAQFDLVGNLMREADSADC